MNGEIVPLKHLVGINERALAEDTDPDREFRYIDIGAVGRGELVTDPEQLRFGDAPSRARRIVRVGDTIVSTVRTYLRAVWPVSGDADQLVVSTGFAVLTPRRIDARFLSWWARSDVFIEEVVARSVGVSYPAINAVDLGELPVRVPPPDEQRAIADFLDTETARIESLIAKKRRLIAHLEERVYAQIRLHVAHSGLVAGGDSASVPVKRVLGRQVEPGDPSSEMITAFRDGTVTARSKRRADGYTESWTGTSVVQRVRVGDVVLHGLDGFSGAIGRSDSDGVCSPAYHVCRPLGGGDSHFYGRLLRFLAVSGYLGGFATSTRERAVDLRNWDLVGRIPVPLVPLDAQRKIGAEVRRIERVKTLVERSAHLAAERKRALVTAVVMGELEVPGVAA